MKAILRDEYSLITTCITVENLVKFEIPFSKRFQNLSQIGINHSQFHQGNNKKQYKLMKYLCEASIDLICFDSKGKFISRSDSPMCPKSCRSNKEKKHFGIHSIQINEEKKVVIVEIICFCIPKHLKLGAKYGKFRFTFKKSNTNNNDCDETIDVLSGNIFFFEHLFFLFKNILQI